MGMGGVGRGGYPAAPRPAAHPHPLPRLAPTVFIAIAVFIADGVYICIKLGILSYISVKKRRQAERAAAEQVAEIERAAQQVSRPPRRRPLACARLVPGPLLARGRARGRTWWGRMGEEEEDGGHKLMAGESEFERALRRHVFVKDEIPW